MLSIKDISKTYRLAGNHQVLNALSNVSFTAKPGEIIGIIGKNGSGKSTLLKVISGLVAPTSGEVRFVGKISSLLEIGGGIHPELSGRENYFLKGQMMGLSKKVLREQYEELLAFTELNEFIDEPVKHYSNGMYMRLAMGIGLTIKADIYLFDEVISVGDVGFQQKCFNVIQNLAKSGAIILMVSHNHNELEKYCNRFIWLEKGKIHQSSSDDAILNDYLDFQFQQNYQLDKSLNLIADDVSITGLKIFNGRGASIKIQNLDPINIEISLIKTNSSTIFSLSTVIQDFSGLPIFSIPTFTNSENEDSRHEKQLTLLTTIEGAFLNPGFYTISIYLYVNDDLHRFKNVLSFSIHQSENDALRMFAKGFVRNNFEWKVCRK